MANDPINVADLDVGTKVRLLNGDLASIVDNPRDGMWLVCRALSRDGRPVSEDNEEAVFVHNVVDVVHDE